MLLERHDSEIHDSYHGLLVLYGFYFLLLVTSYKQQELQTLHFLPSFLSLPNEIG